MPFEVADHCRRELGSEFFLNFRDITLQHIIPPHIDRRDSSGRNATWFHQLSTSEKWWDGTGEGVLDATMMCRSDDSSMTTMYPGRCEDVQKNRTLVHPRLPQPPDGQATLKTKNNGTLASSANPNAGEVDHGQVLTDSHTFVVTADTQLGMIDLNRPPDGDWNKMAEIEYCRSAIQKINELRPKPLFCCVCGDLVDMIATIHAGTPKLYGDKDPSSPKWTKEECDELQDVQNRIFRETFAELDPDIPLVCLCGNHDVGNQPSAASIQRFKNLYGDDYLAFWANGTYNIVLNSCLISRPFNACDLYQDQLEWLEERLRYARFHKACNIFVFMHHPLFLYDEMEDESQLTGVLAMPKVYRGFPDSYFPIPRERRKIVLQLLERYQVTACFAGHFHQNVVTKTSFGMEMIITGPLSVVMQSTGAAEHGQELTETQGFRLARVQSDPNGGKGTFSHEYVPL